MNCNEFWQKYMPPDKWRSKDGKSCPKCNSALTAKIGSLGILHMPLPFFCVSCAEEIRELIQEAIDKTIDTFLNISEKHD